MTLSFSPDNDPAAGWPQMSFSLGPIDEPGPENLPVPAGEDRLHVSIEAMQALKNGFSDGLSARMSFLFLTRDQLEECLISVRKMISDATFVSEPFLDAALLLAELGQTAQCFDSSEKLLSAFHDHAQEQGGEGLHARVLLAFGELEVSRGEYSNAVQYFELGREAYKALDRKADVHLISALSTLTTIYFERGHGANMSQTAQELSAACNSIDDRVHPEVLAALHNLAGLHVEAQDPDRAEGLYFDILRRCDRSNEDLPVVQAETMYALGVLYREQYRRAAAIGCFEAALERLHVIADDDLKSAEMMMTVRAALIEELRAIPARHQDLRRHEELLEWRAQC